MAFSGIKFGVWARLSPLVLAVGAIVISLFTGAGETPATAALLSIALIMILILAALIAPPFRLRGAVKENVWSICGFFVFVLYGLATTLPAPDSLAHPLYAVFGLPEGYISLNPTRTLEGLAKLMAPAAAFAIGAVCLSERSDRDRLGLILMAAGLIFVLFALGDFSAGRAAAGQRLNAGLASANAAATVFGLFLLAGLAMGLRANRGAGGGRNSFLLAISRAPFSFILILLLVSALLLTASRGGVAATLLAVILFAGLIARRRGLRGKENAGRSAVLGLVIVVCLVALFGAGMLAERMSGMDLTDERVQLLLEHWSAAMDRPIFGHGLNTFHAINRLYATPDNWASLAGAGATHNILLQHFEESGLIGLVLFAGILAPPVWRVFAASLRNSSGHAWACLAASATLLVFAHGMLDFGMNVPAIASLYALILGAGSRRDLARS